MILHEGDPDYFNQGYALYVLSVFINALLRLGGFDLSVKQIVSIRYNQAMVETKPFNWYERGALKPQPPERDLAQLL